MNKHTESLFFRLIRLGLGTEKADGNVSAGFSSMPPLAPADWREIYELGVRQGVAAIQFDGLQLLKERGCIPPEQMPPRTELMRWYAHAMLVEQSNARQKAAIRDLAAFYSGHGIRMMLLKGYGLSLLYLRPEHRPCGDIDIWLYGEQQRADALLNKEIGIKIDEGHHHHTLFSLNGVMVENHYDFFNIHAHLSTRAIERELHELVKEQGERISISDSPVYLPPPTFNALFLLRHAGEHFAAAEIALRHLTDWAMFVMRYKDAIDWPRLEALIRRQNMHRFFHCLNAICVDYLGMAETDFPGLQRDKRLEARVMQDILHPSFYDKSALQSNLLQNFLFRFRRWWNNRWKHRMVYREGLLLTFLVQIRSHLMKPGEWK